MKFALIALLCMTGTIISSGQVTITPVPTEEVYWLDSISISRLPNYQTIRLPKQTPRTTLEVRGDEPPRLSLKHPESTILETLPLVLGRKIKSIIVKQDGSLTIDTY